MKPLVIAGAALALATVPAAAIPPGSPIPPGFPPDARSENPPIWVAYHGIEKWIFNPVQCVTSSTIALCGRRRVGNPQARAHRLERWSTVAWGVSGPSGIASISAGRASYSVRLVVSR
jgi:hypothetical protein